METLLLGEFSIPTLTREQTLEKIKKYISKPRGFFHIVSLNPENIVVSLHNRNFKRIVKSAPLTIIDGVGIAVAARMLNITAGDRYAGVDLMTNLISHAGRKSLRVLLIGGKTNLALKLAECYQRSYPKAKFIGLQGINNIKKTNLEEEKEIFRIVRVLKPHFVFVAFGSPYQEIWLNKHKRRFSRLVCMGVGGAFDYAGGSIRRPNKIIQTLGLEWLMRLVREPWRWRRQLRLIKFMYFVIKQKAHEILEIPFTT